MHLRTRAHPLSQVLTELSANDLDLGLRSKGGYSPLKIAVVVRADLPTAQRLILLGAEVQPDDFLSASVEVRLETSLE